MTESRGIASPVKVKWRTTYKEGREYIEDQKIESADGCWLWPSQGTSGRPVTSVDNKKVILARFVWATYRGKIPEGLFVLHTCDNPGCVNPEHLFLGTKQENTHDMIRKGRGREGLRLSIEAVVAMKSKFNKGSGYRSLAREYGVTVRWVREIMHGKRWKGVGEDTEERSVEASKGLKKITNKIAKEIRAQLSKGYTIEEMEEKYGVCKSTVYRAKRGETWST